MSAEPGAVTSHPTGSSARPAGSTAGLAVELFARLFDVPRGGRAERVERGAGRGGPGRAPPDRLAKTYSGGMVRRLELAQALVNAPRLLILDEPTIGLDPIARDAVWEHIDAVRDGTGMTVLVTTHYMDEADRTATASRSCTRAGSRPPAAPADLKATLGARTPRWRTCSATSPAATWTRNAKGGIRDVRAPGAPPAVSAD